MARNNDALAAGHRPEVFSGDVEYFLATRKPDDAPDEAAWHSVVDGQLRVHRLDCAHDDMTGPEASERIGAVLTRVLTEGARGREV